MSRIDVIGQNGNTGEHYDETLPAVHTGRCHDLPSHATTMWVERNKHCPHDPKHVITGSTRRMYCNKCGIYWNRG